MDTTDFKFFLLLTITLHFSNVIAQQCVSPANSNGAIPFEEVSAENRANVAHNGRQLIMTSYQFQCCGNITAWRTFVHPSGDAYRNGVYSITFQVWRPTSPGIDDGCFSLAGEDKFKNITLIRESQGLVNRRVPETFYISVQPGDVVGFFLSLSEEKEGSIQFNQNTEMGFDEEQGWFNELPLTVSSDSCPFPIGPDQILTSSLRAAPVLSLDIAQVPCNIDKVTTSLQTKEPVKRTTTDEAVKSTEIDKPTSLLVLSENGNLTGLIVAVVVLALIVLFMAIVIFVLVCLIVRKETAKKTPQSDGEEMNSYTSPDDLKDRANYANKTIEQDGGANSIHEDDITSNKEANIESSLTMDLDVADTLMVLETIYKDKSTANASHEEHEKATIEEVGTKLKGKDGDALNGESSSHEGESVTKSEE